MQVPQSFSEKRDISAKESKERSKSKKTKTQSKLKEIIEVKEEKKEMYAVEAENPSESNLANYNQQFFDYKSFKASTKRKNSNTNTLTIKKSKKNSNTWIKKESTKPKDKLEIDSVSITSNISEDLAIDINNTINENLPQIKEEKHSSQYNPPKHVKVDRKERQKMPGYKCELCQQFYETLDENPELLCEECSRHRTDQNPSSTPKGFYDLSI